MAGDARGGTLTAAHVRAYDVNEEQRQIIRFNDKMSSSASQGLGELPAASFLLTATPKRRRLPDN
jgi:hypothetical protein